MDEIDQLNVIALWIKFDGSYYIYEWKITFPIWVNYIDIMGQSMIGVPHLNPKDSLQGLPNSPFSSFFV
jgi:hypothetical protein